MSRNINPVPSLFFHPGGNPPSSTPTWHSACFWFPRYLVAIVFLFAISSVAAQDATPPKTSGQASSIHGTVSTIQDNLLSGVAGISVKLSGGPLHGAPLSADTDEHGAYAFPNLEPGTYSISITLQGFKSILKSVILGPKQQMTQDFILELEVVAEKV